MTAVSFLRRWLPPAAVVTAAVGIAACNKPPSGTKPTTVAAATIGGPLYQPTPAPVLAPAADVSEPIVVQGVAQFDETITLSAEVDGKLELVATPLDPNQSYDLKDPKYAGRLVEHPRDPNWKHVRLVDGDPITKGVVLARLDDSQAMLERESLLKSMEAADIALKQSRSAVKDYQEVLKKITDLGGSASALEVARYRIELVQAQVSEARLNQEYVKLKGDYDKAADRVRRHLIRSEFDGKVVRVLRPRGVVVKAGEPIIEVQNTGRFRVEVKVDSVDADLLTPYLPVAVEPVRAVSPMAGIVRHRQEVTGVAVFSHADGGKTRPVVVSSSADGTAVVWDPLGEKKQHVLTHPSNTGVRCVAAAARGDARWVATGGSDGKVRLWDVTDLGNLPAKPAHEFEEAHAQGVGAAAFSPDAQFLATAAGREVFVWDAVGRKKKYALPADHRDEVKAVYFTPQATLVTVCRDKSIRVWTLGTDGATLARTIDHRSGAVDVLGVTADGGRVLFDQDAGRVDLVSLADGRTTGSLQNATSGQRFSGLALFSPDGKMVVTGAGDADAKGELQLWAVPEAGRGTERKRLATPGHTAVTCAAFSPDPAHRFVAVGMQNGDVRFWVLPPQSEQPALSGKLVSVTRNVDRTALIRVEVENAGGKSDDQLQDRGTATLIIDPKAKPVPPTLPAPPPVVPATPGALVPPVGPIGGTAGK